MAGGCRAGTELMAPARTLLLLCLVPHVLGRRLQAENAEGRWGSSNLELKLFTWNSGLQDLREVSDRLFRSAEENPNIEVVAVCQTEAEKPMADYVDEKKWLMVGHGEHWGIAGGKKNSQMLSVFYRKPEGTPMQVFRPPEQEWAVSGKGLKGYLVSDKVMSWASIPDVLRASTERHMNSATGKGGVSVKLDLEAKESSGRKRAKTSLALVCGHLNSESESKRDDDFLKLLRDGSRRKDETDLEDLYDHPGLLFDQERPENDQLDAVVIFGDLNYRVKYQGAQYSYDLDNDDDMSELLAGSRRSISAQDDQLNPQGADPKQFVKAVENGGFGLECNQPHELYFPTYKRFQLDACLELEKLRGGGNSKSTLSGREKELVKKCYVGKMDKAWKLKEQDKYLQAGWLDRFCFRSTDRSIAQLSWSNEKAWGDLTGSDHVAVEGDLTVMIPQMVCEKKTFQDGAALVRAQSWNYSMPEPALFAEGEMMKVVCPTGKSLVDGSGGNLDSQEIECAEDWESSMPQCKGSCELPMDPKGGKFIVEKPGQKKVWEGEQLGFQCKESYYLAGDSTLTCVGPQFDSMPACYKDLRITIKDFSLSGVDESKVSKAKVKLFPRMEKLKVNKDYLAKVKGSPGKIKDQSLNLGLVEAVPSFLHVELCSRADQFFGLGSSCERYAASVLPQGDTCPTCLRPLVEELAAKSAKGDPAEHEISMEVQLTKGGKAAAAAVGDISATLKLSLVMKK